MSLPLTAIQIAHSIRYYYNHFPDSWDKVVDMVIEQPPPQASTDAWEALRERLKDLGPTPSAILIPILQQIYD